MTRFRRPASRIVLMSAQLVLLVLLAQMAGLLQVDDGAPMLAAFGNFGVLLALVFGSVGAVVSTRNGLRARYVALLHFGTP